MKAAAYFLCLATFVYGQTESASGKPKELRATIADTLKREFKFQPLPKIDESISETSIVVLPRVEVRDTSLHGLDQAIREKQEKVADERFSWKKGGTIAEVGRMKVMFKYDPERGVIDLLKASW